VSFVLRLLKTFGRVVQGLAAVAARAIELLAGAILVGMVCMLTYSAVQNAAGWRGQVLWLEEVARYGLIQLAMLGAALALRAGAHQGVDALTRVFPPRLRRAAEAVNWVLIAAFGVYFAACGLAYVQATAADGGRLDTLAVARWPFYVCYPLAGGLFALFAVEKLLARPEPAPSPGEVPPPADASTAPGATTPSAEAKP
jgi:TRAP-type C4-dicarboxylate transport system permease small subunit